MREVFLRDLEELRGESWLAVLIAGAQLAAKHHDNPFEDAIEQELHRWWRGP